ncbi:sugar ABC transporter substrate-binding protein [Lederbergia ruris]|uniref:Sugar ABC transporter substrate-binding protein n=1 Tax=Lederbergia ruris TaxID=217495 RepID=A0ABQ4KN78_9BACI|nr:sugar ABC transporter substrate-binding protein [Lederbergia ruris]GIN59405.1 sugar ABC transporter substrate-binding protein [Lederbergia ruris]
MKKIYSIFLILIIGFTLVGCSTGNSASSSGSNGAKASTSSGDIKLTYWYWADNTEYSNLMQDIIKEFNETNDKGITVVGEEYPWDGGGFSETLFTAAIGGGGPDVASFKLTSTPLFTANNLLANLDDFISDWEDKEDIDENIYGIMKEAGGSDSIYVMPWNTQVLYVYYRPSIFEEAGIEVPETYEEFLTAIERTTLDTNGDGKTDVYGFGMRGATGGHEPWGSFIHGRGGSFNNLNSEESIKGMQDFVNIYERGFVPPTATTDGFNEVISNFKSGKTAMTIHHTGSSAEMVETFGDDVSAFAFPKGDGQWTSMGDTENVIFESSQNKEAAFEWVAYLATGKGQELWTKATGNVPVSKRVQEMDHFQNDRFMQASIEGMSYAGIIPIRDTTTEWVSTIWPNTVASALLGDKSVEETMKILQEELYK